MELQVINIPYEKNNKLKTTIYFENSLYHYEKKQTKTKITYEKSQCEPIAYRYKIFYDGLTYYINNFNGSSCAFIFFDTLKIFFYFNPNYYEDWRNYKKKINYIDHVIFDNVKEKRSSRVSVKYFFNTSSKYLNIPVFSTFQIFDLIGKSKIGVFSLKKDNKIRKHLIKWKSIQKKENFSYFFVNKWREKILPILNDFIINPHKEDCSPVVKKYFQINIERYFDEFQ
jgi:hypothetical protein